MKVVKALIKLVIFIVVIIICYALINYYKDDIVYVYNSYFAPWKNITLGTKNPYYRDYDFTLVQNTDNFTPNNKQDILNVYYTILNSGKDEFTFYCLEEQYKDCLTEIEKLANDQETLSDINNYVHPYNSFEHIETEYDSLGRITVTINKTYKPDQIDAINRKVDEIMQKVVKPNVSTYDNIKNIHNYIINHTKYDTDRSDYGNAVFHSNSAYGPLFEGRAVCGGYSDLMALFLEKLNVKNIKVSSEKHVWNAVYLDNKWLNLDLTWDDPVASDGNDYLEFNYFLIDTNKLLEIEKTEHNFNKDNYQEIVK